ncbi:MAG: ParB/RepB/Spo0J family partition protein [Lachnospiraceae bacterium]|nr:ParB/RepB/Spo0J family partition protein [Lachnospiraceae bacterium]
MAAVKKSGLGKGLDNLIPQVKEKKQPEKETVIVEKKVPAETIIKIADIEPNKKQPRQSFDEEALSELADSIKQFGVIQPLIVQKRDGYYEIIAGERRWRASKLAGIKEVPVVIKDYSDEEIMEIALIENIQREDLNPIEEARAYKRLLDEYHLKQEEVADKVSKSRVAITNSMRLLKLCDEVQNMVIDGMISGGHARALISIDDKEKQVMLAQKIYENKLSVRETEKLVKDVIDPKIKQPKEKLKDDFVFKNIENRMKDIFGTKVKINRKDASKGKIEIEYYSVAELERILEIIAKRQ